MTTAAAPHCYRHEDRETHIRCQRCERPICPDCMRQASVGFQCPTCVAEGSKTTRQGRATYGGRRSENPARTSQVLIAINVAVWIAILATGGRFSPWVSEFALLPAPEALYRYQDGTVELVTGVAGGAWWQLLTSMFTHIDFMHIGFNMLALWFLGPQLEAVVGRTRFLALYFLSGLAGSAAVFWLSGATTQTVGASGAIFGLMGALLILAMKARADYSQILLWLGLNVAITVFARGLISWQGHFGGLVGGVLIALALAYSPRARRTVWQSSALGLLALIVALAVISRAVVLA